MRGSGRVLLNCAAIRHQVARHVALEYPEIVQRDLRKGFGRHAEVLRQNRWRRMREPVSDQQRVEFVGVTVVKTDDELAAIRSKALQGMRSTGREIPEIAGFHIGNIGPSLRV